MTLLESNSFSTNLLWHYQVYGLHLASNIPLDGLVSVSPSVSQIDLRTYFGMQPSDPNLSRQSYWQIAFFQDRIDLKLGVSNWVNYYESVDHRYLRIQYIQGVTITFDKVEDSIWVSWLPSESLESAYPYFIGNGLGIFLRLHDVICLHACTLVVNGEAFAISGHSGMGKSTLAGTFIRRGYKILSDDIAVLRKDEGGYWVQPGYPRIRLLPETLALQGYSEKGLKFVHPKTTKRYVELGSESFSSTPQLLKHVFVLVPTIEKRIAVEPLASKAALLALIRMGYGHDILDAKGEVRQLQVLSDLIQHYITVSNVFVFRDIGRINELADRILERVTG